MILYLLEHIGLLKCHSPPTRVVLAFMAFLALALAYAMHACLGISIINHINPVEYQVHQLANITEHTEFTIYSEKWILRSFYIAYIVALIPSGILSDKYGGKWVFTVGMLASALLLLLSPAIVQHRVYAALIVLLVLKGLSAGVLFPAIGALLSVWVPRNERSRIGSFVYSGALIGSISSFYLSVFIMNEWPWRFVFLFWSTITFIWSILFTRICFSDPESHPFISVKEREYLIAKINVLARNNEKPPVPWNQILPSIPIWSLIIGQIGYEWGLFVMVYEVPKFLKDIWNISLYEVGVYASLPYMTLLIVSVLSSALGDYVVSKGCLKITNVRKLFTFIAAVLSGVFLVCVGQYGCSKVHGIVYFTLAMGSMGFYISSVRVNALDLSPNYSGTLIALTSITEALTGIVNTFMTPNYSLNEWQIEFWFTFGVFLVTMFIYIIGASGDIQEWDRPKETRKIEKRSHSKDENSETANFYYSTGWTYNRNLDDMLVF